MDSSNVRCNTAVLNTEYSSVFTGGDETEGSQQNAAPCLECTSCGSRTFEISLDTDLCDENCGFTVLCTNCETSLTQYQIWQQVMRAQQAEIKEFDSWNED